MIRILLTLLLVVAHPASASGSDFCKSIASLAKSAMNARQNETPITSVMDSITGIDGSELAKELIILAYQKPLYHTEKHKRTAVTEFENWTYLACISR